MLPVIPLVLAGGLLAAVVGLAASRKDAPALPPSTDATGPDTKPETPEAKTPGADVELPSGATPAETGDTGGSGGGSAGASGSVTPGQKPADVTPGASSTPANSGAATPSPAGTGASSGAISTSGVSADDGLDTLIAAAIAKKDVDALEKLAQQAVARGLYDVARSIRDEIARIKLAAPAPTPIGDNKPKPADVSVPTGRAILSMKAGSRGPDVIVWQGIVGAKPDAVFGQDTHNRTVTWQRQHGLTADGIVGPKTWEAAYSVKPVQATVPRPETPPPVISKSRPILKRGSTGASVKEWQGIVNSWLNTTGKNYAPLKVDSVFGAQTEMYTKLYQTAHGLTADGIVGPKTWEVAYKQVAAPAAPAPVAAPSPVAVPESPTRQAAVALTDYLKSIGGLKGRGKEDKSKIKSWQSTLGQTADGMYGRSSARAVMMQGLVPVTPFYWPSTGASAAKAEFLKLVDQYAAADPSRAGQWSALKADVNRS